MKRILYGFFIVAIALFGITFSYQNQQTIDINYYFGIHFQSELLLLLFITFALGLLGGSLAMLLNTLYANRKLFQIKRQLRAMQKSQPE